MNLVAVIANRLIWGVQTSRCWGGLRPSGKESKQAAVGVVYVLPGRRAKSLILVPCYS